VKNAIRLAVMALAIAFCIAACGGDPASPTGGDITYTAVQIGGTAGTTTSSGIEFTFSASVDSLGLTAANITVGGVASKGTAILSGSGATRTLSPITVNSEGTATVSISKEGIASGTKNVAVYKQSSITYNAIQIGGAAGTTTSTGIEFTFGASVDSFNLIAANITVGGVASKGEAVLSGSGATRTLSPITVNSEGTATVSISKEGIASGTKNVAVYKKAGPVWTTVNSTFGLNPINAVAWGDGRFVAVGDIGKIAYSTDGISWTAVSNSNFGMSAINCVAWGDGKFIAGGEGGKLAYSTEGATWELVSNSSFSSTQEINGITSDGNGNWVAVGRGRMAYSTNDGVNWTGMDSNIPFNFQQASPNLRGVAFGNDTFVLVGAAGGQGHGAGTLAYSTNGSSWTKRDMEDLILEPITDICFGNGKFVAHTQNAILYFANATGWNKVAGLSSSIYLYGVAAGGGKFAAVGAYDTILFSDDGISWEALPGVSIGNILNAVAYGIADGAGTWVAVGSNGTIAYYIDE